MTIGGLFFEEGFFSFPWEKKKKKSSPVREDVRDAAYYTQISEDFLDWRKTFEGFWETVEDAYRKYEYEPKGSDRENLEQVFPGRVYRIVHMTEASIYSNNVKFYLEGFGSGLSEDHVRLLENLGNADFAAESSITREIRLCARDASKYGFGIAMSSLECDFVARADKNKKRAKERRRRVEDPTTAAVTAALEAEVAKQSALGSPELAETTYERDSRVLQGQIVTRRISPWHFGVDPEATSLDDAQRVWRYVVAPTNAVRKYQYFTNAAKVEPTSWDDYEKMTGKSALDQRQRTRPSTRTVVCEMFERDDDGMWRMITFVPQQDIILRVVDKPFWIGHPFRMLSWNNDGDCIFPQSDILPVYSEILSERLLLTSAMDGFARASEDYIVYDRTVIKNEKEVFQAALPGHAKMLGVDLTSPGASVLNAFNRIPRSQMSGEVLNFLAAIERSMMTSSGFSPNQFGQALKSGTSATEAGNISAHSTAAQAHKLAGMETFLANLIKARLGLAMDFYETEDLARILGAEAADAWANMQFTEADVQQLRVCIKPGSTKPVNEELRAQQAMTALQLAMSNPVAGTIVNQVELWKQLFRALGFAENSEVMMDVDPAQIAQLQAAVMLQQGGGGSAPGAGAMPSGDAGVAQAQGDVS